MDVVVAVAVIVAVAVVAVKHSDKVRAKVKKLVDAVVSVFKA